MFSLTLDVVDNLCVYLACHIQQRVDIALHGVQALRALRRGAPHAASLAVHHCGEDRREGGDCGAPDRLGTIKILIKKIYERISREFILLGLILNK